MKQLCIFFSLILLNLLTTAQGDFPEFQKEIKQKADIMKEVLEAKRYISDFEKMNTVGFTIDTFKIEEMLSMRLENDFTSFGMIDAISQAEESYDKLLNTYYQILKKKLNEEDQETLKGAQLNWIKFRDSEKSINVIISMPQYSGGGTMHSITVAYESLQITKRRVLEIYNHISRFYEYAY